MRLAPGGLDDAAAVELLERVVDCPSPSGQEAAVAELLVRAVAGPGAALVDTACVDAAGNAVVSRGRGPRRVTFVGHLDTVPGQIPVRIEGGELHGRGSVDAKGSLCAAVVAATRLPPETLAALTFTVIGAVEEEAPSSRGARHAAATQPRPDYCIIGEPSGWERYTLGYKGRLTLSLTASRAGAHSARDEASAAEQLLDAYAAIRRWVARDNEGSSGLFDRLQVTLRGLCSSHDGLEERCRAEVSLRLPPRWRLGDLEARLAALLLAAGVELTPLSGEEPHRADNRSALARAFRVAIRAHGGAPRPTLKTGTSDMNVLAPLWQVPMLAYGPGDAALDHTPEERLDVAEYLRSVTVLVSALTELAAGPG